MEKKAEEFKEFERQEGAQQGFFAMFGCSQVGSSSEAEVGLVGNRGTCRA